jgi:hypothetical protein
MRLRRMMSLTLKPILRGRRHNRPGAGRNSGLTVHAIPPQLRALRRTSGLLPCGAAGSALHLPGKRLGARGGKGLGVHGSNGGASRKKSPRGDLPPHRGKPERLSCSFRGVLSSPYRQGHVDRVRGTVRLTGHRAVRCATETDELRSCHIVEVPRITRAASKGPC